MSESHSFVTHEELEVCFVKYDMIKTLEKKEDEKKLLEIFSSQNEKISIMNDTIFRNNSRVNTLGVEFEALRKKIERVDTDCKVLYENLLSRKPMTSDQVNQNLENSGLVPMTREQLDTIMTSSSSCIEFIKKLVEAVFPRHFLVDHDFGDVTNFQFIKIFQIISHYFKTAILLSGETLKLESPCDKAALKEVAIIIQQQINIWKENHCDISKNDVQSESDDHDDEEVKLLQLSERTLDKLAYRASSVVFIGRVAVAAFPKNFLLKKKNTAKAIDMRLLDEIYEIVTGRLTEVKHPGKPSVPISKEVVFPIIWKKINNYRSVNRRRNIIS